MQNVFSNTTISPRVRNILVKGIWLYIILLIFEGALRKWILPSLASPLLIIRDPIAIGVIAYAWYHNVFPTNIYIRTMVIITVISSFTTLFLGHGNLYVTVYGARIFLIHFPFLFIIGSVLSHSDVIQVGRFLMWMAIPMTIIMVMQFYSPQSAWVNRGIGGDIGGGGFSGAMGYMRPPGFFSFTNGLVTYYSLLAVYVFYFWLKPKLIKKWLLISITVCLILSIPFSISRSLILTLIVIVIFVFVTVSNNPRIFGKLLIGAIGVGIVGMLVSYTGVLDVPMEVYSHRFEQAAASEGGLEGTIGERYLGNKFKAIVDAGQVSFFGQGIGMGTNAGSVLMGYEKRTFLIAEDEWQRVIGEMGALLGFIVIGIRVLLTAKVGLKSYKKISKNKILPWMLTSFVALNFPQGAWAQPTMLGFSVLGMGLLIASFNDDKKTIST